MKYSNWKKCRWWFLSLRWFRCYQLSSCKQAAGDPINSVMKANSKECSGTPHGAPLFFNEKKWWQEHLDTWHFVKLLQRCLRGNVLHQPFLKAGGKWRNLKQQQFQTEQLTKNSHRVKGEGLKDSRWTVRAHTVCNTTCGTWIPAKGEDDGYIKISEEVKLKGHFNLLHLL